MYPYNSYQITTYVWSNWTSQWLVCTGQVISPWFKMCFLKYCLLIAAVPASKFKHVVEPIERTSSFKVHFVIDKQNIPGAYIDYQCHHNMFPSKHSLVRYQIVIHHRTFVNRFLSKYSLIKKNIYIIVSHITEHSFTQCMAPEPWACNRPTDQAVPGQIWPTNVPERDPVGHKQTSCNRDGCSLTGYPGTTTSGPLSTKEADPWLAKRPLVCNGRLANRESTPKQKGTDGANQLIKVTNNYQCMPSYSACHHTITLNCYTIRSLDAVTPRLIKVISN